MSLTDDIYNSTVNKVTGKNGMPLVSIGLDQSTKSEVRNNLYREGIATSVQELYQFHNHSGTNSGHEVFAHDINIFNRYKTIFPGDEISDYKTYIFLVKPDLNMPSAIDHDPFYQNLYMNSPNLIRNLTHGSPKLFPTTASTHFVSFLSDRVTQYSIPEYQVKTYQLDQPFTGYKTTYAGNSNDSRTGVDFSMEFRESKNFSVIKYFEAWVRYIDMVSYGNISPYREYVTSRMSRGVNEIDYATSIYMIITEPDGTTISYYHKMTGAIPTSVPHSNFSFNEGGEPDRTVTVQFSGGMPEALNPRILVDFNYNAGLFNEDYTTGLITGFGPGASNIVSVPHARLGKEHLRGGSPIVGGPYIAYDTYNREYKLKWRDIT